MFSLRFSPIALLITIACCVFPFVPTWLGAENIQVVVRSIENIQALLLFIFAVCTLLYMRPWDMPNGQKQFWIWAVCWWLVLLGRSISWGRDYFPEVPKIYFRGISIILIGSVVFMLFSPDLRTAIAEKWKNLSLPLWPVGLVVFGLIVSDSVEHLRLFYTVFLNDLSYQSLIEELYEFPLIIGLFLTAWAFMQADKIHMNKAQMVKLDTENSYPPIKQLNH